MPPYLQPAAATLSRLLVAKRRIAGEVVCWGERGGSVRTDRGEKRLILQGEGIPEYWIVDLDARIFERWRPNEERAEILNKMLVWQPKPSVTALEIDLDWYFRSALG